MTTITDENLEQLRAARDAAAALGAPASSHVQAAAGHVAQAIKLLRLAAGQEGPVTAADSGGGGSTDPDKGH